MNNIYNKEHNRCKHSWTIQEKIKAGFTLPLAFGTICYYNCRVATAKSAV